MSSVEEASVLSELSGLRSQIRDLAALLALPGMWRGREVSFIASNLLEALVSLLRLDFAYLRSEDPAGGPPLEERRPLSNPTSAAAIDELIEMTTTESERAVAVTNGAGRDHYAWFGSTRALIGNWCYTRRQSTRKTSPQTSRAFCCVSRLSRGWWRCRVPAVEGLAAG